MRKTIKYLSLVIIVALITVIVMRNGAKADDELGQASITFSDNTTSKTISVGETATIIIKFKAPVTSFSGTVSYTPAGVAASTGGSNSILYGIGGAVSATSSCTYQVVGVSEGTTAVNISINSITYESDDIIADTLEGSVSITVESAGTVNPGPDDPGPDDPGPDNPGPDDPGPDDPGPDDPGPDNPGPDDPGPDDPGPDNPGTPGVLAFNKNSIPVYGSASCSLDGLEGVSNVVASESGIVDIMLYGNSVTVTGISEGTTAINAISSDNTVIATATITVTPKQQIAPVDPDDPDPEEETKPLSITPSVDIKAYVGDKRYFTANKEVTWKSTNISVATITNEGVVTCKSVGSTTIIATSKSDGEKKSITLNIANIDNGGGNSGGGNSGGGNGDENGGGNQQAKFAVSPSGTQTLKVGGTVKLTANGTVYLWESSKATVASVDNKGNVKALKNGTAIITAVAMDGSIAQVKIVVQSTSTGGNTGGNNGGTTTNTANQNSETNEVVPSTGEGTMGFVLIGGVAVLAGAVIVLRKKLQ